MKVINSNIDSSPPPPNQANSIDLLSDDHAWVLPSYYNPNWWNQSVNGGQASTDCSDDEMRKILETVIFIDTVKFPPLVHTDYN